MLTVMGYVSEIRKKIGNDPLFMPCSGVIVYKDKKILLQKRKDFDLWAIHGGSLELGETFLMAAKRELKEETGLIAQKIKPFKLYDGKSQVMKYPNGDISYLINQVFLVTEIKGNLLMDKDEVTFLKWFTLDELPWDKLAPIDNIILKDFIQNIK